MVRQKRISRRRAWVFGGLVLLVVGACLLPVALNSIASQNSSGDATISQLVWGSNLSLYTSSDSFLSSVSLRSQVQRMHVRSLRVPFRGDVTMTVKAASLIKELGISPLIILPFENPSVAQQLVREVNTLFGGNGVSFEFSNERDLQGTSSSAYTAAWNALVPSLKQLAPTARFIGPVMYHADAKYLGDFVAHANPRPDAVSWHEYTCDSSSSDEKCLSAIDRWTVHISDARAAMKQAIGSELPIWITEYNWNPMNAPDSRMQKQSFINAWTTKAIKTLVDNHVFAAHQYVLSDNRWLAMLSSSGVPTPQAQAFQATYEQYFSDCKPVSTPPTYPATQVPVQSPTATTTLTATPTGTQTPTVTPTPSADAAHLAVNTARLSFTTPVDTQATHTLILENTGGKTLSWSASVQTMDEGLWLTIDPVTSILNSKDKATLTVTIKTQGQAAGKYTGAVLITSNGGAQAIFVGLVVTAPNTPIPTPTGTTSPHISTDGAGTLNGYASGKLPEKKGTPTPGKTPTPGTTSTPEATPTVSTTPIVPCVATPPKGVPGTPGSKVPVGKIGDCTEKSPYGVTTIQGDDALVSLYNQLNICWVRYQTDASKMIIAPGKYDFSKLDAVVKTMNAAGIHIDYPIRCVAGGSCFSSPALPTPAQVAEFSRALAERYDGKHGYGIIEAFEIGNEEYDFFPPEAYGPILKAGYQAIKEVYPEAIVGMYGPFKPSLSHLQAVMQSLAPYSQYMDFANFHYYVHGEDPKGPGGNMPTYTQAWQTVHSILPDKPIWVTEIGWPTVDVGCCHAISPQLQAENLRYVMSESAKSGVVKKVFWFTLNYGAQGDTIYPPSGPLPAFFAFQEVVRMMPQW